MPISDKNKTFSKLAALLILLLFAIWLLSSKDMMVTESHIFEVKKGSSMGTIAKELSDKGLIKSELFFTSFSKFLNANNKLKSGYYEILPGTSVWTFIDKISTGSVLSTKVTLIEGKTIKFYFNQLTNDPSIKSSGSLKEVMTSIGINEPYDGWFFPETYSFNYGESLENVLKRSHLELKKNLKVLWDQRDKDLPLKSPYEAIILASLIENETALDDEKSLIAGVFIRRLNQGMRLQTDPTVIYALGDAYSPPLKKSDLRINSLYNTYRNKGLPPGAISSVGYQSLFAALHPSSNTDLYFVSKKDGSHAFAPNYEKHKENIKKYLNNN
ncbi:MAG: endolytic transglycosylase MltG [Gammaproteobacteria bacterium]|nr:endolytic transglycosylase MltG [Gammaproteobacteria bacterium]